MVSHQKVRTAKARGEACQDPAVVGGGVLGDLVEDLVEAEARLERRLREE